MQISLQKQLIKTLDRLKFFANKSNPVEAISPFYHAADFLMKYGDIQKDYKKKEKYFKEFYDQFQKFAMKDFSKLKKYHEQILDEIAQIVQSQTFIQCIRPDLGRIRHIRNSLKIQKISEDSLEISQYLQCQEMKKKNSFGKLTGQTFNEEILQNSSAQKDKKLTELSKIYKQIKKSYEDHCLDDAYEKTLEYLSLVQNSNNTSKQQSVFLKNISDQYQNMTSLYSQFDKKGWILDRQDKGITVQYKIDDVTQTIEIRIQGQGQIPIQSFLSIISEIDLMSQYVPFCYDTKQLKKISRNQRVGTSKIYIPIINDRQTYFYAAGYDRMKTTKSLFFYSKTVNEDHNFMKKYDCQIPPANQKFVRFQYNFFLIQYIPIDAKRAKIRLATKVDMKLNFVPKFIVFKSARIFAFDYFTNIIDRIKNFKGSPWQKKIIQNPSLYKFFHKKIDQFIFK